MGEHDDSGDRSNAAEVPGARRWSIAAALVVVGGLLGAGVTVLVTDDPGPVTSGVEVAGTSVTAEDPARLDGTDGTDGDGPGGHGDHEAPVEDRPTIVEFGGDERAALAAQLVEARDVALRHPTLADAEAAGYVPTTPYAPGTGAHRGKPADAQPPGAPLDLQRPQSYLYDGTGPDSRVVGLMYVQLGGDDPPEGFVGPLDRWSAFRGQCLRPGTTDPVFPAANGVTEQRCTEAGGAYVDVTAWTLHVWVVPGWEAPGGVFAALNDDIVCADGTTDSDPVEGCDAPHADATAPPAASIPPTAPAAPAAPTAPTAPTAPGGTE